MSVFRLKEWWGVQVGETGEEFDLGCMAIGNVDNSRPPQDKVVVASQQGLVRVYNPSHASYRAEDLMLEEGLGEPILQLLVGRFVPAVNYLALAVLHPTKLAVYEVVGNVGKDTNKGAAFHSLQKCYVHDLGIDGKHFSAHNMTSGSFGGTLDRDMIIVQSMDGKLQIFEQSAVAFTRQFIDCLIPGPLAYVPRLDAFVTVNHATHAICYRYQVIASAQTDLGNKNRDRQDREPVPELGRGGVNGGGGNGSGDGSTTGAFGLTAVRSAMVEWDALLGEHCHQIVEGFFSSPSPQHQQQQQQSFRVGGGDKGREPGGELVFICDRSMFLVKESGVILQHRVLDRTPACAFAFRPNGAPYHHLLLANHDGTVQIYSFFQLAWAAKTDRPPVQLGVGDFGGQKGLIVQVDDGGRLSLSYLGTKPPTTSAVSQGPARELDYNKVEEEHRALLHVIRESQTERKSEPKDRLLIRSQLPRSLDFEPVGTDVELPPGLASLPRGGLVKVSVRVFLSYSGAQAITDVNLSVRAPAFVHVMPNSVLVKSLSGAKATPTIVRLVFLANAELMPNGLEAEVAASYLSPNGEPRVSSHKLLLPLFLACRLRGASKAAQYKLTLDTEAAAIPLTELFADMVAASGDVGVSASDLLGSTAAQAMGFQLWAGSALPVESDPSLPHHQQQQQQQQQPASVSILVSKTAGRYRVQSDSLSALFLVSSELERRLTDSLSKDGSDQRLVSCAEPFPYADYFSCIEAHFGTRQLLVGLYSHIHDSAHLFRVVQKKLLARFKDKNPAPLAGVEVMMRDTYARLLSLADEAEEAQRRLARQCIEVSSQSRLLVQMTALRLGLPQAERTLLEGFLCVWHRDTTGGNDESTASGWEEAADAGMTYLLKTSLAKSPKDAAQLNITLEMPQSLDDLKKKVAVVFDRLDKGGRLVVANEAPSSRK